MNIYLWCFVQVISSFGREAGTKACNPFKSILLATAGGVVTRQLHVHSLPAVSRRVLAYLSCLQLMFMSMDCLVCRGYKLLEVMEENALVIYISLKNLSLMHSPC